MSSSVIPVLRSALAPFMALSVAGLSARRALHLHRAEMVGGRVLAPEHPLRPRGVLVPFTPGMTDIPAALGKSLAALRRRRDRRQLVGLLPAWLDATARELRSGATLAAAMADSGATLTGSRGRATALLVADMRDLRRSLDAGRLVGPVLAEWAARWSSEELDAVVASLQMAAIIGGETAGMCESVAGSLRVRTEIDDEVRSLTAQSRASTMLLTVLPVAAAALLAVLEPATVGFLVGTPGGWMCLGVAAGLQTLGWVWMSRLVRSVR